jgi:KTSC domain
MITLIPVEGSSQISGIGYDGDTETLRVQFFSGSTYDYTNVTPGIFNGLTDAGSQGQILQLASQNPVQEREGGAIMKPFQFWLLFSIFALCAWEASFAS